MLTFREFVLQENLKLPKPPKVSIPKVSPPKPPKIVVPTTKGAYPSTMNPGQRAPALRAKRKGEIVAAVKHAKQLSLQAKLAKGK